MPNWIGLPELIIILVIILLLFGAKKLPDIARSIGKSVKEFKRSVNDITGEEDKKDTGKDKEEHVSKGDSAADEKKG
ncbi:twin-arginine translocase TatA/TatE family subunit [Candidatus Auribacterota bacterium]